jgi:hypothetical protein
MRKLSTIVIGILLAGTACGKKDENKPAASPSAKGGDGKGGGKKDLGAPTWKKLEKLGLQLEMPASAEFLDTSADAPGGHYFTGNNECSARVNETTLAYTDDFEKAKKEVETDPGAKFVKWTKAEKTADGWAFEWEAVSAMDESRKLWGVQYRRKFGEKQVECWEKADNAESAACTVKACLSLKPL